MNWITL